MNSFSKYLFEHLHFGLEEKDFTLIEKIIFFLIILNCVFVVIESEKLIYEQYNQLFDSAKLFFGIIFLIEYICRLIAVDQIDKFKGFKGKIKYIFTVPALRPRACSTAAKILHAKATSSGPCIFGLTI